MAQGQQIDPRMRMAQQQTQQQPMGAMNPAMAQKAVNQSYDPREVQVTGEANNDDWTEMTEVPAIFRKKV